MPSQLANLRQALKVASDPDKAIFMRRYFKTGPGEYAAGDTMIGITVPTIRKIAKQYRSLPLVDIQKLVKSQIHEFRLCALLLLVEQYKRGTAAEQEAIAQLYVDSLAYVNNWDLVDSSARYILGPHLFKADRKLLKKLAASGNLWQQRVAVLTTFHFITHNDYSTTFELAELLLTHDHDLMHKAIGWMLREVGNRDQTAEEKFLKKHYKHMPRTMLRYAIEKFPPEKRLAYLHGKI
jgi:3-methyladenine DNA glycosylase AlkD